MSCCLYILFKVLRSSSFKTPTPRIEWVGQSRTKVQLKDEEILDGIEWHCCLNMLRTPKTTEKTMTHWDTLGRIGHSGWDWATLGHRPPVPYSMLHRSISPGNCKMCNKHWKIVFGIDSPISKAYVLGNKIALVKNVYCDECIKLLTVLSNVHEWETCRVQ